MSEIVLTKRAEHMDGIDKMPPELRQCVHEYGAGIVNALVAHGISAPRKIHYIVREIWDGPRGWGANGSKVGNRTGGPEPIIDWLLISSGSSMTAATLARALWERGFAIVPREPSPGMIEASKATISNFDKLVTKSEKHRLRLRAAVEQYVSAHWTGLFRKTGKFGS